MAGRWSCPSGSPHWPQVVDRLIIVKTVGPEHLGAYGAIADFLKQSFVVFGEALALSLISIAKREARDRGDGCGNRGALRRRPGHGRWSRLSAPPSS